MTVHILRHGAAYCGKPGLPGEWSGGHTWIGFEDPEAVRAANCAACLDAFASSGDGPGLFAGGLFSDRHRRTIKGSRPLPCAECKRAVLFSPATLARPEAKHPLTRFLCLECASKVLPGHVIGRPTAEQKQELLDNGVDPEAWPLRKLWGKKL